MKQFFTETSYILHQIMVLLTFLTIMYFTHQPFFALTGAVLVSVIKELLDMLHLTSKTGFFSNNDLVADALGLCWGGLIYSVYLVFHPQIMMIKAFLMHLLV